jgi:hypothetical protein
MAMFIVKPWYRKKDDAIYGAEWAGTSDPSWVRTDAAVGFSDPNPYYSGMSTTPSSPFDNILPWSGMRRVTDANAGELVEIPKFYYKWTRDGVKMKLQISMSQFDGSHVSPAHADRGDGVGERDYIYVGRYHCASDYKSKTGVTPKVSTTRSAFRSGIHNLGNYVWQSDFAMRWTIIMLYLVEYANWDSQAIIGYGCGNNNSIGNMGYTDSIAYHTGTTLSNRSSYGLGTQYRYIEGLWDNCWNYVDGIYINSGDVYMFKNPSTFADTTTGGSYIGNWDSSGGSNLSGYIKSWTSQPEVTGFEYAILPNSTSSNKEYTCDFSHRNHESLLLLFAGGKYSNTQECGISATLALPVTSSFGDVGSRLMVLPPSRLSA